MSLEHTDKNLSVPKINLHDNRRARVECICDMCKQHTKLNVLVCCLSRVRKRAVHNGLENHGRVSCTAAAILTLSLRHSMWTSIIWLCYYLVLKNFCSSNFHRCRPPMKYFNDKNLHTGTVYSKFPKNMPLRANALPPL